MAQGNLAGLADVQAWANEWSEAAQPLLARLIASASRFVLTTLQRPTLVSHAVSELRDGSGSQTLVLREWPVTSVSSLMVGPISVPPLPTPPSGLGYVLEPWDGVGAGRPQKLVLRGQSYWMGALNVQIGYTAGYLVSNEAVTVPGTSPVAPQRCWAADGGVSYASGAALTPVPSNPTEGQYVPPTDIGGNYLFSEADSEAAVLITYSYVPDDLRQACIELVGERYKYMRRIGEVSHTLAGQQTIAFSQKDMHAFVAGLIQPYKRLLPI